jgi:LuxR family maltose regulon positive regulatory protein
MAGATVVPGLQGRVETLRARFWLEQGKLAEVAAWLTAHPNAESASGEILDERTELEALIAARARLARGDRSGTLALLTQLERQARAGRKRNALIEILVLKALSAPDRPSAFTWLEEALSLGCPEGYLRVFLNEGEPLRELLVELAGPAKRTNHPASSEAFPVGQAAQQVLEAFETPPAAPHTGPAAQPSPLTGRELEILGCMAQGLTNQEIGRRLYISAGTVKAHSAAIYRKLDVANRAEAISRAKDLGLI